MQNYAWDVVYACSGNYINRQLTENADKLIQSFLYEDSAIRVTGTFGAWQIVPGGSGPLLQFITPITHGSALIKSTNQTFSLDNTIPLVQMQLTFQKGNDQAVIQSLIFNCATLGNGKGDTSPGAVTVIDPDTSGNLAKQPNGAMAAALLVTGLGNVFLQNTDQLNFVFAEMLPVPVGQNADWLTPVSATYAYQQPDNNTLGGIAILGVLDGSSINSLPQSFDTSLLLNEDFGFVLSARAFMKNVILPSLPSAFQGNCNMSDFMLNADNSITLARGFNLNSVRVGLIDYTPNVTAVNYHLDDNSMRCYVATKTDITGLADAYITNSVTSNNISAFDVPSRTLSFQRNFPHFLSRVFA
jgi:hypothetical protein